MRKWGGYQVSRELKKTLIDIHRQALMGLDIIATSENIVYEDRRRLRASYKRIINLVRDTGVIQ